MVKSSLNHVSIVAHDIEESINFYTDLFGMHLIPSPNYETHVEWLQCGELQLHLFDRDVSAPTFQHFALHVDDFQSIYEKSKQENILTDITPSQSEDRVYVLPNGGIQMYIQDPSGNLVEVNYPNVEDLNVEKIPDIVYRDELNPEIGEDDAENSSLYNKFVSFV